MAWFVGCTPRASPGSEICSIAMRPRACDWLQPHVLGGRASRVWRSCGKRDIFCGVSRFRVWLEARFLSSRVLSGFCVWGKANCKNYECGGFRCHKMPRLSHAGSLMAAKDQRRDHVPTARSRSRDKEAKCGVPPWRETCSGQAKVLLQHYHRKNTRPPMPFCLAMSWRCLGDTIPLVVPGLFAFHIGHRALRRPYPSFQIPDTSGIAPYPMFHPITTLLSRTIAPYFRTIHCLKKTIFSNA